jgi:hypothetical protein
MTLLVEKNTVNVKDLGWKTFFTMRVLNEKENGTRTIHCTLSENPSLPFLYEQLRLSIFVYM